jgi:hypothetical protein
LGSVTSVENYKYKQNYYEKYADSFLLKFPQYRVPKDDPSANMTSGYEYELPGAIWAWTADFSFYACGDPGDAVSYAGPGSGFRFFSFCGSGIGPVKGKAIERQALVCLARFFCCYL